MRKVTGCAFCAIVEGTGRETVVFEDGQTLAFLDNRPLFPGHCLLIPKAHYETFTDLPPELIAPLFLSVRLLAGAVERALAAEGTFVAINNRVSQSVPHLHIHVVPRRRGDGLRGFFWPRRKYETEAEMERVRNLLRDALK